MPWSDEITTLPISTLLFSSPISLAHDNHLMSRLSEIKDEIKKSCIKPFVYFAIGTANQSINNTNPSVGNYVTKSNIQRQQYPEKFITEMKANGYDNFVINIDDFPNDEFLSDSFSKRYFIKGAFPLKGTVGSETTQTNDSLAIQETIALFDTVVKKDGKVLILNCVGEAVSGFSMFEGIKLTLQKFVSKSSIIYASSYLQAGTDYNLFKLIHSKKNLYISNLSVSELTYNEVFGI